MKTDRRKFITGTASLGIAATLSAAAHAQNSDVQVRWTCIASWPKELDILMGGAKMIAARVLAMSGGKFQIDIVEDGKINKDIELLDAVSQGIAECGHTASDYYSARNSALNLLNGVPFGMTADEHLAWLRFGGGLELAQSLYDPYGVRYFPAGNTGTKLGGWFNKEIHSVDDLKGLKIRIGGISAQVFTKLGASAEHVPYLQLAQALKDGKLDAVEFTGPHDDLNLGIDKAANYFYAPGWWHVGDQLDLLVNEKAFAELPEAYQEILASAAYETNSILMAEYAAKNMAGLQKIIAEGRVQLKTFPNDFLAQAHQLVDQINQENSAENPDYQRVFANWNAFYKQCRSWRDYLNPPLVDYLKEYQKA